MLTKIKRKDFLGRFPDFPQANYYRNTFSFPDVYQSYVLTVDAKSTIGLCNNISTELISLMNTLNFEKLSFLGDTTTPWLFREHDYRPVKRGLEYLLNNKVSKGFNGALQPEKESLPEFLKHLFWLVRCNGVVFNPHFSDNGFNLIGNICHFGNVHLSTLNEETDIMLNEALDKTAFIITEGRCIGKIFKRSITG